MIKRALNYYKPYKGLFGLDLLCAILVAALEMIFPQAVTKIVDELIPLGDFSKIMRASLFLFGVYFLCMSLYYIIQYWGEKMGMYIENDMRVELFSHLQKLSFSFYDNNETGQLISKLINDLQMIGVVAHYAPEQLIVAAIMLIITLIILAQVNWVLSVAIIGMVVLILFVNIVFTRKTVKTMRALFVSASNISSKLEESLSGIRVVQSYTNEGYQMDSFYEETLDYCKHQARGYRLIARCNAVTYYLTRTLPIIAIIGGSYSVLYQGMSTGTLFSFILLTNLVLKPIEMLSNFAARYPKGLAGFKNFLQIMDIMPEIQDGEHGVEVDSLMGDISFKDVEFAYDEENKVLNQLTLDIKAGQTVAFVGYSGAGKSTICGLIPRFYQYQSGSITIDGMPIEDMTLKSLRSQVGVVMQDVFLFSGTIEENLRFAKPNATVEEMVEAIKKANLLSFVEEQPLMLQTVIGERGVKMSGGQKQRLAIARMFLKNPPILILDEATSALDAENETVIHQSLKELSEGRTTLIIAHRFSTIKEADRIFVIDDGRIVHNGSHEQLYNQSTIYKTLYDMQKSA